MNNLSIFLVIYLTQFWLIKAEGPPKIKIDVPGSIRMNTNFTVTWTYLLNNTDTFESLIMRKDNIIFANVNVKDNKRVCKKVSIYKFKFDFISR
jgi:hypothetical protein